MRDPKAGKGNSDFQNRRGCCRHAGAAVGFPTPAVGLTLERDVEQRSLRPNSGSDAGRRNESDLNLNARLKEGENRSSGVDPDEQPLPIAPKRQPLERRRRPGRVHGTGRRDEIRAPCAHPFEIARDLTIHEGLNQTLW